MDFSEALPRAFFQASENALHDSSKEDRNSTGCVIGEQEILAFTLEFSHYPFAKVCNKTLII
jgi:hypothetical protein